VQPALETAGPGSMMLRFGTVITPATWFLSARRDDLVQIQPDRFTRNWSKVTGADYPSYAVLRPRFALEYEGFLAFLDDVGMGEPSVTQCELTYINPIKPNDVWSAPGDLPKVLSPWSGALSEGFLPNPDDVQIAVRYPIRDEDGSSRGRLNATLRPQRDATGGPVLMFTLAARVTPAKTGQPGVLECFDLAHEWIVRGFTTMTTEPMHNEWGRTQ
jgi:uncharacterized protein (TIGR04255 family)